jgi:hypothetical protein
MKKLVTACLIFFVAVGLVYASDPPPKVEDVQVEVSNLEVSISWTHPGANQYTITYCTSVSGNYVIATTEKDVTISNLKNGEYLVEIVAKNDFGESEPVAASFEISSESEPDPDPEIEPDPDPDPEPEPEPELVSEKMVAEVIFPNQIFLEWEPSSEIIEGYSVYLNDEKIKTTSALSTMINADIEAENIVEIFSYTTKTDGSLIETEYAATTIPGEKFPQPEKLTALLQDEKLVVEFLFESDVDCNFFLQLDENNPLEIGTTTKKVFSLADSGLEPPFTVKAWADFGDGFESTKAETETVLPGLLSQVFVLYDGNDIAKIFFSAEENVHVEVATKELSYVVESGSSVLVSQDEEIQITPQLDIFKGETVSILMGEQPLAKWILSDGWHLISSPISGTTSVLSEGVTSAWKWENAKWQVFLPGEDDAGAEYAEAKGFDVLQDIGPKEGLWVNIDIKTQLAFNGESSWKNPEIKEGWNLLGAGETPISPYQFFDSISIWKWKNAKWQVFLPGEDDAGAEYAQSKGFDVLTSINPGEGFWLNN